jgi:hypothetical protein
MVITMVIHIVWAVTVLLVALLTAALVYKIVVGPKVMRAEDIAKAFLTVSERIKVLEEKDKLREQQVDALKMDNTVGSLGHRIRNFGNG